MPDASTQTTPGKKIKLIKLIKKIKLIEPKKEESDDEYEEICCKCKTDEDVFQCMECDKYFCALCDPNEMATYGDDYVTMCHRCSFLTDQGTYRYLP